MKNNKRIIILAGIGKSTNFIFNALNEEFKIEKLIMEKRRSKIKIYKRRIKQHGIFKAIGQMLFLFLYKMISLKSKKRINEIIKDNKLNKKNIPENNIIYVENINCKQTIEVLKDINPDVVIVNGTSIIKPELLCAINSNFLNIHAGITPKYRGVHGGYWALTQGDQNNCGVTVHLVDKGIDTGGILYQKYIKITNKDNFSTYPYLQISNAIPLMIKAVNDVSQNNFKIKNNKLKSKLWTHPTICEYMYFWFKAGVK